MRFDCVIIGGGLAGLTAGLKLQSKGLDTAIVSTGQNALHFFSGSFESMQEAPAEIIELFSAAGIKLHYEKGVRLMPLGTFRDAELSLEDIELFKAPKFAKKALVVNLSGFHDFFASFLAEGLEKQGISCQIRSINFPELEALAKSPSEMRSVQIARIMDRITDKVIREVRMLLNDEDAVVLPQVFGLQDSAVIEQLRKGIPVRVVFAGTLPPSVPGIRTQMLLKRRYEALGGTFMASDEVVKAHLHEGRVHSIATRNLDNHFIEADNFILATGGYFSKGLRSNPFGISEPIFGLDVRFDENRSAWYNPSFAADQPYMKYGVVTDASLHALREEKALENVFAIGSILGGTRPELGTGAGLAIRSALEASNQILNIK